MEQAAVVVKIKKLLNMAKRGTKHEREVAYLKAQEMTAKYHIEQDLLQDNESKLVVEIEVELNVKAEIFATLAQVIAKNFRSKFYVTYHHKNFIRPVFLGLELDAQVASEIFKDAYKYIRSESTRIAHYYHKMRGYSNGIKDDWQLGFVQGLNDGFDAQIQSSDETSLMIIIPEEVKKSFQEMTFNGKDLTLKPISYNGHSNVKDAAYQNGYDYSMKRRQQAIASDI